MIFIVDEASKQVTGRCESGSRFPLDAAEGQRRYTADVSEEEFSQLALSAISADATGYIYLLSENEAMLEGAAQVWAGGYRFAVYEPGREPPGPAERLAEIVEEIRVERGRTENQGVTYRDIQAAKQRLEDERHGYVD